MWDALLAIRELHERYGHIQEFESFTLDNIKAFYESFSTLLSNPPDHVNPTKACEQLAMLSYFLYRGRQPGIWIDCSGSTENITAEEIARAVRERFCPKK